MKSLIDTLIIGIYFFVIAVSGKYSLSYIANKVRLMAIEKVVLGLGDLEPVAQKMTGKKLKF